MQRFRKFFASFFLSIFAVLLLHQIVPHVHHSHDLSDETSHYESGHFHTTAGHHHHHEKQEEKEDRSDFNFLGFLLGNHSHSALVAPMPLVEQTIDQTLTAQSVALDGIEQAESSIRDAVGERWKFLWHAPPQSDHSVYLASHTLRGPPSHS